MIWPERLPQASNKLMKKQIFNDTKQLIRYKIKHKKHVERKTNETC